jgi:leucyl-tRNA synthetase
MAVPAHDQRDFEFAKKYNIPIKEVIQGEPHGLFNLGKISKAYSGEGKLIHSDRFSGMPSREAKDEITKHLESLGMGKKTINYKLRDWLISRQRYWGTPIPVVYCDECGIVPVPEKELPVELPEEVKFGEGNPLKTNEKWVKTSCPKCKNKNARRETDTMDTFVNSSWYFLRYTDAKNKKEIFSKERATYWMPVDTYIGGKEHATMHLIYSRFYTKFLRDMGILGEIGEPAKKLFNQGMLHGNDGFVMSKSRGNVVLPEEISEKYGIDTARLFLMSIASPDRDIEWSEKGIEGSFRFIKRITGYFENIKPSKKTDEKTLSKYNHSLKEFSKNIEEIKYNLAIISLREFFDFLEDKKEKKEESKEVLEGFLKMLSLFCPHISEEFWHSKLKNKSLISLEEFPQADESKINPEFAREEQIQKKLIEDIRNIINITKKQPKKIYIYSIPPEVNVYKVISNKLEEEHKSEVAIYASNSKDIIDPEGKAKKAKQGKPAVYLE